MTDTYYKEYEKFLQLGGGDNKHARDSDVEDELFTEHDNSGEYSEDITDGCEQPWGEPSARPRHESAPILVDDDDEIISNECGDEPPVLEPAPRQSENGGPPTLRHVTCNTKESKDTMKSYSRHKLKKSSSLPEKQSSLKTYSSQKKIGTGHEILSHLCKSSKENGNIFDKFTTLDTEDGPPPLIPSPEALHLHRESPSSDPPETVEQAQTHNSPDFVAMEADSTSEVLGGNICSQRISKNSVPGDVMVECDSTCMLGASPLIVSPASVSNSESEIRYQSIADNLSNKSRREEEGVTNHCGQIVTQSIDHTSHSKDEEFSSDFRDVHHLNQHTLCPELESEIVSVLKTTATPRDIQDQNLSTDHVALVNKPDPSLDEPPVLCAIPLTPPHNMSRLKRHTIDGPDTFSCQKRSCSMLFPKEDDEANAFDTDSPPAISHVSELFQNPSPPTSHNKGANTRTSGCSPRQSKKLVSRHCCHSSPTPLTSTTTIFTHQDRLSEHLVKFALDTCLLSNIQSRMHRLLRTLFPLLRSEIEAMSPESIWFQTFLSDLVTSLQQGHDPTNSLSLSQPTAILSNAAQISVSGEASSICKVYCTPPQLIIQQESPSPYSPQCSTTRQKTDSCNHATAEDGGEIASEFSHLHLAGSFSDMIRLCNLRPVKIHLSIDSDLQLCQFSQLSCEALQLLLPNLTVSLCNEVAQSPSHLMVFIDNVIAANSKGKRKD